MKTDWKEGDIVYVIETGQKGKVCKITPQPLIPTALKILTVELKAEDTDKGYVKFYYFNELSSKPVKVTVLMNENRKLRKRLHGKSLEISELELRVKQLEGKLDDYLPIA